MGLGGSRGGIKMAFAEQYLQPQQWDHFTFYATGGANGVITESIDMSKTFKLMELRVHCSAVFASVEDLTMRLSSPLGSQYNLKLVSQAMNGVQDYLYICDNPAGHLFASDDQIIVSLSLVSAENTIGIKVIGWSVQE